MEFLSDTTRSGLQAFSCFLILFGIFWIVACSEERDRRP